MSDAKRHRHRRQRLALALDALDAAVERRREADRNEDAWAAQVQALGLDRARLASALDGETARSRRLEATNREVRPQRRGHGDCLDSRSVLEGSE